MPNKYQRFTTHHRTGRRPSWRELSVAWIVACVLGAGVAHAEAQPDEGGEGNPSGTMVAPASDRTVAAGVRRMLPGMVKRLAHRRARSSWRVALDDALVGRDEGLLRYYSDEGTPIFTDSDGFTPVGSRVFALLHEAPYHGLSHLQADLQLIRKGARHLRSVAHGRLIDTGADADSLAAAWSQTRGTDDRLASTAAILGTRHAEIAAANESETLRTRAAAAAQAGLEVRLAAALADMGAHIMHRPWIGGTLRDDKRREISPDALWFADPVPLGEDLVESLFAASQASDERLWEWFEERLPPGEQYMGLVGAARHYASLCTRGGWEPVRVPWATRGKQWKATEHVEQVQRRLAQEGFLGKKPSGVYDDATVAAMRAFRKAHQIGEKGTFDKEVAAAMNIPCERKLQVILLNLRRWRHTARTAEDSFVEVNIAAMEVSLVLDGEPVARERTAVGAGKPRWDTETKRYIYPQATPIMQGSIERIVVNPWWNVPGSIYEGEYKRKIDSDPTWLDRHNYVLKPTAYGARLIQLPGPTNALGQLKIVFQNDASIYLHDTSQKGWFKFPRRDVSHGCIRVQNVFDFATKILQHDREKRGARFGSRTLHHMAKSNPSNTQALPVYEPMRVFLEYYTASISETGDVAFHPDIYDYDRDVLDGPRRKGGRRRR